MEMSQNSQNSITFEANQPENTERYILAQNITFFRKKLNLSQTELAKKIQYSNKNVSKWERGETTPDVFTIKKLANIFGVSVDTLLSPIDNETKTAIKTKNMVPLRWKIYMLLLANAILIMGVCITFFVLKSVDVKTFPLSHLFVYILPAMDLSIFIFICCIKRKVDPVSLSVFGWLMVTCFYISFINSKNIEYIYIIAAGFQIIAPIFAVLVNTGNIIKINRIFIKMMKKETSQKIKNTTTKSTPN